MRLGIERTLLKKNRRIFLGEPSSHFHVFLQIGKYISPRSSNLTVFWKKKRLQTLTNSTERGKLLPCVFFPGPGEYPCAVSGKPLFFKKKGFFLVFSIYLSYYWM